MHDGRSSEHERNGKHMPYLRDEVVVLLSILRDAAVLESKRMFCFKVDPVPKMCHPTKYRNEVKYTTLIVPFLLSNQTQEKKQEGRGGRQRWVMPAGRRPTESLAPSS
jgi:hypothetical protein